MSVHGTGYVNPAKSFLERYSALSIQLEIMRREVIRQRDSLTNITAHLKEDVVQTSGAGDKMADGVARIVDAENQFAEEAYEADREHICKKKNSYPIQKPPKEGKE